MKPVASSWGRRWQFHRCQQGPVFVFGVCLALAAYLYQDRLCVVETAAEPGGYARQMPFVPGPLLIWSGSADTNPIPSDLHTFPLMPRSQPVHLNPAALLSAPPVWSRAGFPVAPLSTEGL